MRLWALLAVLTALAGCGPNRQDPPPKVSSAPGDGADWYRRVVFYELWVRSFQDSNGDGIGDLPGLISRLDYLADLGVGALWLMPTYPSPLVDSGYDVADYADVHPDYGTLADLDTLLAEAHRRNVKVLLDWVINHTSNRHAWFEESRANPKGPKGDWYIWADQPGAGCNEDNGIFGNERWTFDAVRGQYYFHQFFPGQPDLNFRSPSLRAELLARLRFWLDRGVDGFRLDVPYQYVENWPSCWHQPESFLVHQELRATLDAYDRRAMVGELCCTPQEVLPYLGNGRDAFHMVFYFPSMHGLWGAAKRADATDLRAAVGEAVTKTPPGDGAVVAHTLGNHDILRTTTTVSTNTAMLKAAATAQLSLPGAPFVYYGEELGLSDGSTALVDLRDFARSPMPWDSSANGGFTSGTPFLPLAGPPHANVEEESTREGSLLSHYRRLLDLRNHTLALQVGSYEAVEGPTSLLAFFRHHPSGDRLVVVNFSEDREAALDVAAPPAFAEGTPLVDGVARAQVGTVHGGRIRVSVPPRGAWVLEPG